MKRSRATPLRLSFHLEARLLHASDPTSLAPGCELVRRREVPEVVFPRLRIPARHCADLRPAGCQELISGKLSSHNIRDTPIGKESGELRPLWVVLPYVEGEKGHGSRQARRRRLASREFGQGVKLFWRGAQSHTVNDSHRASASSSSIVA